MFELERCAKTVKFCKKCQSVFKFGTSICPYCKGDVWHIELEDLFNFIIKKIKVLEEK